MIENLYAFSGILDHMDSRVNELISIITSELSERKWSMRELGRRSGTSGGLISQVLSGDLKPSSDFCIKIACALDKSIERLLWLAGHINEPPTMSEFQEAIYQLVLDLPPEHHTAAYQMLRGLQATGGNDLDNTTGTTGTTNTGEEGAYRPLGDKLDDLNDVTRIQADMLSGISADDLYHVFVNQIIPRFLLEHLPARQNRDGSSATATPGNEEHTGEMGCIRGLLEVDMRAETA